MKTIEETLSNEFEEPVKYIEAIEGYHKNAPSIYQINERKVVVKKFSMLGDFEREVAAYKIFKENPIINIPRLLYFGENIIVTEFVKGHERRKAPITIKDWAKVHSYFLNKSTHLDLMGHYKHNENTTMEEIFKSSYLFGDLYKKILEVVHTDTNKKLKTLIHGDLMNKNIIASNQDNFYIDFEFSGMGHPTRDLTLTLLENSNRKDEIIRRYRENIEFDYEGIERDLIKESILELSHRIIMTERMKVKNNISNKIKSNLIRGIKIALSDFRKLNPQFPTNNL